MKYYDINRKANYTEIAIDDTVFYIWFEDFTERKLRNAMKKLRSYSREKIAFNDGNTIIVME